MSTKKNTLKFSVKQLEKDVNQLKDNLNELIIEKRNSPRERALSKLDASVGNYQLVLNKLTRIENEIINLNDKVDDMKTLCLGTITDIRKEQKRCRMLTKTESSNHVPQSMTKNTVRPTPMFIRSSSSSNLRRKS